MTVKRLLLLLALLVPLGAGSVLAHAELASSEPSAETTVTEPLEEIRLGFSEAVELGFSLFKVDQLDTTGVDLAAENARQRLNGLAGALVSQVIESRETSDPGG